MEPLKLAGWVSAVSGEGGDEFFRPYPVIDVDHAYLGSEKP